MERACGLKDAFSFKDINTGETSIDKAKGGHEKWFKIVNLQPLLNIDNYGI